MPKGKICETNMFSRLLTMSLLLSACYLNVFREQGGIKGLNNTVMQLRKICQHPFVFPQVEDTINPSKEINSSVYRASGKVALLDRILPKLFAFKHRVGFIHFVWDASLRKISRF